MHGLSHGYRELVGSVEKGTRWICRERAKVNDLRLFFMTLIRSREALHEISERDHQRLAARVQR